MSFLQFEFKILKCSQTTLLWGEFFVLKYALIGFKKIVFYADSKNISNLTVVKKCIYKGRSQSIGKHVN